MAVKDHRLDAIIIESSKQEFLKHGYNKASLHTICKNANITTGALYTRYKNKDALFESLVKEVFDAALPIASNLSSLYMEAHKQRKPDLILEAIHQEQTLYQEILFDHYDACVLLFARCQGSEVERKLKQAMDQKAEATAAYFQSFSDQAAAFDGIALLLNAQFYFYKEVLDKGYPKEKALACLKTVSLYQEAGWKALFDAMLL